MKKIQEILDSLQPYVIGIRYLEGTVLVDVVFKEGWVVPDDNFVKKEKGTDTMNYYMLYSDSPKVGLDEILSYVEKVIKINLEKEKKYELLKTKVNELKELFKNNSLIKLNNLKFTFSEDLVPNMSEFNLEIDEETYIEDLEPNYEETIMENTPTVYLDENKKPIETEMTDEELEILEEEARAERNRLKFNNKQKKTQVNTKPEITKTVIEIEKPITEPFLNEMCDCGPNEACNKCIDKK